MPEKIDKVVAITGAGSGIGAATARLLAARGARILAAGRRAAPLVELVGGIAEDGGVAAHLEVDVTRRADLERLVAEARARFGRLDVLVGNAGIAPASRFEELCVDDWEAMIDVNLKGILNGIAAALPGFLAQGSGHFVNIISTAGLKIVPGQGVYGATKNAVRTVTEALRQESGGRYRVTGISPGFVRTDLPNSMTDGVVRDAMARRMAEIAIPPEAVARAALFAIEQPDDVDVGEIVIRPTVQD